MTDTVADWRSSLSQSVSRTRPQLPPMDSPDMSRKYALRQAPPPARGAFRWPRPQGRR
eukprot:CAMPEP_0176329282 /NCGR_PEP_ID=MMETSP0121_2-20121125/75402_1 /TAXON_ID=160619 /ORGANISM="Kryptoperidinium foliaceum, Strain CCMP 1326" /LENGTH=57 /DNA_ID=CAMNT_0017671987 /DNA_START=20 /DNA_END=190 /DNA_ORIENTATION=-